MVWILASAVMILLCICAVIYAAMMKKELKNITQELKKTQDIGYDRQLRVTLFDKDLTALAAQLNENLDYQKHLKQKSEDAEERWKQSVSDISHDLRTPLTVVRGNLQMLEREGTLTEKQKAYAAICMDKTDALKHMVDDFFELSVLESDSSPVETKSLDMTTHLVQFIIDHEAVIREKGLQPEINLLEKSVIIYGNELLITRMLENLLGNVLKYAKDSFCLSMKIVDEMCEVSFANRLGTENIDETQLFSRTYQGNRARTGEGAGLGLYIVKLLAEKQGADVFARKQNGELVIGVRFAIKKEI